MPPHSKSRQCRTVQNDTLTQEVWDVMSSWKCSRPSHLSLSASRVTFRSSFCFLALCHLVCLLHSSPLLQFLLDTLTCTRVYSSSCNRKIFVLFYCLFRSLRACSWQCFETGTWHVADSKECWIDWMAAEGFRKEPGWHWTARFPDSDTTTQNASRCRNCNVLHASGQCMRNKQKSSQSGKITQDIECYHGKCLTHSQRAWILFLTWLLDFTLGS